MSTQLSKNASLTSIQRNSELLARAARRNLQAPVPTCPAWTVADLVAHIGIVHHFWENIVRTHAMEPVEPPGEIFEDLPALIPWQQTEEGQPLPPLPAEIVDWFLHASAGLVKTLENAGPNDPAWHWSGDHRVEAAIRMQVVETATHRWDVQNAVGGPQEITPEVARSGIDHFFDVMLPASLRDGELPEGHGERFLFVPADGDGVWWIRFDAQSLDLRHQAGGADATISGTSSDLFLFLWNRLPLDNLQTSGDPGVLNRFREFFPPVQ